MKNQLQIREQLKSIMDGKNILDSQTNTSIVESAIDEIIKIMVDVVEVTNDLFTSQKVLVVAYKGNKTIFDGTAYGSTQDVDEWSVDVMFKSIKDKFDYISITKIEFDKNSMNVCYNETIYDVVNDIDRIIMDLIATYLDEMFLNFKKDELGKYKTNKVALLNSVAKCI